MAYADVAGEGVEMDSWVTALEMLVKLQRNILEMIEATLEEARAAAGVKAAPPAPTQEREGPGPHRTL